MRVVRKAFFGGGGGGRFVEPEADEEIGGEADQFPADEEEEQAVGDERPSIAAANRLRKQKNREKFGSSFM